MGKNSFGIPVISLLSYVDPCAEVIGDVDIEENVIVAPHVSIRADEGSPHKICKGCNVQDGVVIHGLKDLYVTVEGKKYSVFVDSHCSLGHQAIIHGPTCVGKKSFVGFRAIIHNSIIGVHCHIGHGAIIEGVVISDNRYVRNGMVIDSQEIADSLPEVTDANKDFNRHVVDNNKRMKEIYLSEDELVA